MLHFKYFLGKPYSARPNVHITETMHAHTYCTGMTFIYHLVIRYDCSSIFLAQTNAYMCISSGYNMYLEMCIVSDDSLKF